jgi:succinate-semialdehyde dehydrogenase/glutarate-semialdehyde dehydrogenase
MPWNFPFWQFFRCAIPAILAGNTILLKHAEQTTGSALMIAEIFNDAGFPQGVMQTIVASHIDTEKLLRGRIVQGLSFTGSTKAGKHLAAIAAVNLKKVVMELGGSDPMIILENVDIVWAAKIAFTARHQNNGETCIAAKRLIIAENIYSQFISEYKKLMNNISFGNPLEEKTTMGPLVNDQAKKNFESMIIDASDRGAKITRREHQQNSGYFFAPCLVENVTSKMRVWVEETFAPITVIRTYKTVDEAIALANHSDFGLGASVLGNDIELCKKISTELEAGVIFINNIVKSDAKLPFGGTKSSGIGRELADLGLGEFCHVTTVNVY